MKAYVIEASKYKSTNPRLEATFAFNNTCKRGTQDRHTTGDLLTVEYLLELCGGSEDSGIAVSLVADHLGSLIDGSLVGDAGQGDSSTQAENKGELGSDSDHGRRM
jgi:hypothetical protein